jgi:ElaA protein
MIINWSYKKFFDLSPSELYHLLQLRSEVFVVEQNCVFLDMDNIDQQCFHLSGYVENKLVAYARIVPPGIVYTEPSIGRVVTAPSARKKGLGKLLMKEAISLVIQLYGNTSIKIGAQYYLKQFYADFGFYQASDVYLEDGIEHVYMMKQAST